MDHSTLIPDSVLTDVSHFIGNVLSEEKLSDIASEKRQSVLKRLTVYVPATNPYLDMNAGANKAVKNEYVGADNHVWEEEEYEECPAEMENFKIEQDILEIQSNIVNAPNTVEDAVKIQRAASELKNICAKSGPLLRKERRFFRDQFRCCWGAIYEGTLYFYTNERASKPTCVTDLVGFKARALPDLTKDVKKRDACFEVVCPGKKSFQLVARTAKDMQQWVAVISQESSPATPSLPTRRQLPSIPCASSDGEDVYDDVDAVLNSHRAQHGGQVQTDEIYDDIKVNDHSDVDSIYDDIGIIYPESVFNRDTQDTVKNESNPTKVDNEITKLITQQETVEDEDFYDDIGVYMKKDLPAAEISNDNSLKDSPSTTNDKDPIKNKNEKTDLHIKQETAEDEDIYDDVDVLKHSEISRDKSSTVMIPKEDAKNENPEMVAKTPHKGIASKEVYKKEMTHKFAPINQTAKKFSKPDTFPKPSFKAVTHQGAAKPSTKPNIQNLIQKMESSLQMK